MPDQQHRFGTMRTARPERYAKQLVSHWSQRSEAATEAGSMTLRMDTGNVVVLRPRQDLLEVEIVVPAGAEVDSFAQVVKEHLERFGQRETLELVWS